MNENTGSLFEGVLAVGVTGHRHAHFDAEGLAATAARLRATLQTIAAAFPKADLRLVTSLASGADSLAADAALELKWHLQAVLPAARELYALDFENGARTDFLARLARSSAVFELPSEGAPLTGGDYERAGRVMLDQCDLLIAVWDGQPARGRGGTAQIVEEAVSRHVPVLYVSTDTQSAVCILWSGFDPHGLARTGLSAVARSPLSRLVEIRLAGHGSPPTGPGLLKANLLLLVYPVFLAALGVRPLRASDLRPPAAHPSCSEATKAVSKRTGQFGEALEGLAHPRHAAADALATYMALLYRGGFVANFSLSALAVLLALAGLMVNPDFKWLLTAGEVSVVCGILWLTHTGRKRGWHRRWIEQRHLAERLRSLMLSAQLGGPALAPPTATEPPSEVELRQTARALGLPAVRVDADYLELVRNGLVETLDDQISYNQGVALRMHQLDHRLHRLGTALFALSAASCACVLPVEVGLQVGWLAWLDTSMPKVSVVTVMLSAALPAIGAAIYGIRMQGDFTGVAGRAHGLADALSAIRRALDLGAELSDAQLFDELRSCLRMTAQRMSSELTDWRSAHSARPLILPG